MSQSDEPITAETVTQEVFGALEDMAQDGGSELGEFGLLADERDASQFILYVDGQRFLLTVKELV